MSEPTNGDIMRVLGNIEATTLNTVKNAEAESQRASESRRVLHEKIENTTSVVQQIASKFQEQSFQLRATTDIAIQARDGLNAFRAKFEKEAAPILEGVQTFREEVEPLLAATRTVRNWSALFAVLAGAGLISAGGIVVFFNDAAKAAVKAWLGI